MNIDNLKTYLTVVKMGSFSKAAKALHISQPAISIQIKKLEQDLGVCLINRSKNGLSMTFAGRTLFHFSEYVIREQSIMLRHIDQLHSEPTYEINIISSPIPAEFIIPNILSEFKEKCSLININLAVSTSTKVIEGVTAGNYAAGFCSTKTESSDLEFVKIAEDDIVLVVCPSHPISTREDIYLYELSGETLIMRDSVGNKTGEAYMLMQAGLDFSLFKTMLTIGTFSGVTSTVERGIGISFLPYIAVKKSEALGLIRVLRIKDFVVKREYYFLCRKYAENSRSLEDLKQFLLTSYRSLSPRSTPSEIGHGGEATIA